VLSLGHGSKGPLSNAGEFSLSSTKSFQLLSNGSRFHPLACCPDHCQEKQSMLVSSLVAFSHSSCLDCFENQTFLNHVDCSVVGILFKFDSEKFKEAPFTSQFRSLLSEQLQEFINAFAAIPKWSAHPASIPSFLRSRLLATNRTSFKALKRCSHWSFAEPCPLWDFTFPSGARLHQKTH
jgi:hypothetical protein